MHILLKLKLDYREFSLEFFRFYRVLNVVYLFPRDINGPLLAIKSLILYIDNIVYYNSYYMNIIN